MPIQNSGFFDRYKLVFSILWIGCTFCHMDLSYAEAPSSPKNWMDDRFSAVEAPLERDLRERAQRFQERINHVNEQRRSMQENRENIRLNSLDILQDLQVRRDRVRGVEVVLTAPSAQPMESRWGHLFLRFIMDGNQFLNDPLWISMQM